MTTPCINTKGKILRFAQDDSAGGLVLRFAQDDNSKRFNFWKEIVCSLINSHIFTFLHHTQALTIVILSEAKDLDCWLFPSLPT
jgi:hypothetical protein